MKIAICNAFSLNMLERNKRIALNFFPVSLETAKQEIEGSEVVSAIGHAETAKIVGDLLGVDLPVNRIGIKFEDELLVAQYTGPRLPEGATVLPEGAKIEFWLVNTH